MDCDQGFILFCANFRATYQERFPTLGFLDVDRILRADWTKLPTKHKFAYATQYEALVNKDKTPSPTDVAAANILLELHSKIQPVSFNQFSASRLKEIKQDKTTTREEYKRILNQISQEWRERNNK